MLKYTDFWTWFKSIEQNLRNILDQCDEQNIDDNSECFAKRFEFFDQLSEQLKIVSEGLLFEFGPKDVNNKISFFITANGEVDYFEEVNSLVEAAPELEHFVAEAFSQRIENPLKFRIKLNEVDLGYDQVFFKYYLKDNKVTILIAAPGFEGKFNDNDKDIMLSIHVLLDKLLGEYDAATLINVIKFNRYNDQDIETNGLPLIELRTVVDFLKKDLESVKNSADKNIFEVEPAKEFVLPSDEEIAKLTVQEKLEIARDVTNDNNYDKALAILDSIKEQCGSNAVFFYRYSFNLMHTNRFKEALYYAKKSHELDKSYRWAYLILSQLLYWQNDFIQAYEVAKAGLKIASDNEDDKDEFLMVLLCMFKRVDFCDPNDFENSVLLSDFDNYDDQADSQYKIGTVEFQWVKFDEYYGYINLNRKALDFYVHINAPLQSPGRHKFEDNTSFYLSLENLGICVNSDTFLDSDKDPESVYFNFDVYTDIDNYEDKFIECLQKNIIPKGTEVTITTIPLTDDQEPEILKSYVIGEYDLAVLVIDNTKVSVADMKKYTYEQAMDNLLDNIGVRFYTYVDKEDKTYIYYATKDFHSFAQLLKDAVSESVFSKGCVVFNATANV